ncbi:MAG: 4,5-dihydroxyphthalate decarboxylase [Proteobacteria bacterium]|nr:4,5-dihydroxyphthalate decarboxylase [Burkholderiales bacterium]
MPRLTLSIAIGEYDHVTDLVTGRVPVEGIDLVVSHLPTEEIFYRSLLHREWDISEVSIGKYVALRAAGDDSVTAIPVFPSRAFRHSMFYVREDGGIRSASDLIGRTIGIPEWGQTAGIYGRGFLADTAGLPLASIEWVQAGLNDAGRTEKVKLTLPQGVRLRPEPTRTLNDMLLSGEIDCAMTASPPRAFVQAPGKGIVRLFPDYRAAEEDWYRATGIYPIMHAVGIRTEVLTRHPWVAMNLYRAFDEARRRSMARMDNIGMSHAPLPWLKDTCDRMRALFGADWFPYGVDANRTTLEALCRYAHAQGLADRALAPEALFAPTVLSTFKV